MPEQSTERAQPPAAESAAARQSVAWWALLVALAACGAAGWSAWQARDTHVQAAQLRETLASRLAEGESLASEARGIVRQQQETIASLQGKLGVLESKVEATEGQAAALEALYQEFSRSREDHVVSEVEQAVALAAQQLQLAGNVEAALIALNQADARLAAYDRGQYAPLRRALARDTEALKLQPAVDVPGLGLRLERLLERADVMPLAFEGQLPAPQLPPDAGDAAPVAADDWLAKGLGYARELADDVWREVRGLVRMERLDQDDPVLLAPAQNTFLRENLKIRLLTARLALLARDGRTYAADLAQARAWVERFFDLRDERVQGVLHELKELESVSIRTELPTLTESFAALRTMQVRGERPAAQPEPAAIQPAADPEPDAADASPAR
ncbi:uroporphyrinogen-III C-methyltransferase [Thauera linaloolentis]|nr:uroporphyrinogen-III C-methyltransferase [Thauera linaloolentis]MCM8564071.1 uroporphyrinogen-III C-methyltransferase [Thauera linaloolentis]